MTTTLYPETSESIILGSCQIQPSIIPELANIIEPTDFAIQRNGDFYDEMVRLYDKYADSGGFDHEILIQRLRTVGKFDEWGGLNYIQGVVNSVSDINKWKGHAFAIQEAALRRHGKVAGEKLASSIERLPIIKTLDEHQALLDTIRNRSQGHKVLSFKDLVVGNRARFADALVNPDPVRGLRTNMAKLDRAIGGFVGKRLYIIYGATNMGKSTLAVSICRELIMQGPGMIISTESPPDSWLDKLVSAICQLPYDLIESGQISDPDDLAAVYAAYDMLESMVHCEMLDAGSPSPTQVGAAVRAGLRQHAYKWVIIDSVSKMKIPGMGASASYEVASAVADELQDLCREVNLPFICTAQVKRDVGERGVKIPNTEDAAGGATLGNNADVVMSLYNHNHYVELGRAEPDENFPEGTALVRITKHRWRPARNESVKLQLVGGAGFWEASDQAGLNSLPDLANY